MPETGLAPLAFEGVLPLYKIIYSGRWNFFKHYTVTPLSPLLASVMDGTGPVAFPASRGTGS